MDKSEDGKALVNVHTISVPAADIGTFKITVRLVKLGLLGRLNTELVQEIPSGVSAKPPLGATSVIVKAVLNCVLRSVCAAPVTATPAVVVVMFGKVKPLVPVKLKVPVPPNETFATATVVGLAVLV